MLVCNAGGAPNDDNDDDDDEIYIFLTLKSGTLP